MQTWQGSQGPALVSLGGRFIRDDGSSMYAESCLVMHMSTMSALIADGRLLQYM